MPRRAIRSIVNVAIAVTSVVALLVVVSLPDVARATTPGTIYSYDFSSGGEVVANAAAANSGVAMTLVGDWSPAQGGVFFHGDTSSSRSAGYAKPAAGATVSVPADEALGAAVRFTYQAPDNEPCFDDTRNVTQVGRYRKNAGQLKIQLSSCRTDGSDVYPQCRVGGAENGNKPETASVPLVDGEAYIVQCIKEPDPAGGQGSLILRTSHLQGGEASTIVDTFATDRPGLIETTAYVSVANKYPLPAYHKNTDQFVGVIAKVSYCQGVATSDVASCLDADIGAGSPPPTTTIATTTTSTTTTTTTAPPGETEILTIADARADAGKITAPKWQKFPFVSPVDGEAEFVLTWDDPGADLRYKIRDGVGNVVNADLTSDPSPKSTAVTLVIGADYTVAIWAVSGASDYTAILAYGG